MITDYSSLQDTAADWLNRRDMADTIPTLIQLAEGELRRDPRCRSMTDAAYTITADGQALPADVRGVVAWYHDDGTPITTVGPEQIGPLRAARTTAGKPLDAAVVGGNVRLSPEPDTSYATVLTYWRALPALSDSATTNWLLEDHPDVYLFATLVQSAPYLKDDPRLETWRAMLERALEGMHADTDAARFGGVMRRRFTPIGG